MVDDAGSNGLAIWIVFSGSCIIIGDKVWAYLHGRLRDGYRVHGLDGTICTI